MLLLKKLKLFQYYGVVIRNSRNIYINTAFRKDIDSKNNLFDLDAVMKISEKLNTECKFFEIF